MARQHDLIVNRLLANFLEEALRDGDLELGGSPISYALGHLHRVDTMQVISAAKKRLAQLERMSRPLGPNPKNWIDDIRNANREIDE